GPMPGQCRFQLELVPVLKPARQAWCHTGIPAPHGGTPRAAPVADRLKAAANAYRSPEFARALCPPTDPTRPGTVNGSEFTTLTRRDDDCENDNRRRCSPPAA